MSSPSTIGYTLEPGAIAPFRAGPRDAGVDLSVISVTTKTEYGVTYYTFDTGVHFSPPADIHAVLCLRSSMQDSGWFMSGGCDGVIDSTYRGTIRIKLCKHNPSVPDMVLPRRICQLIFFHTREQLPLTQLETLDTTARGSGGFGSTDSPAINTLSTNSSVPVSRDVWGPHAGRVPGHGLRDVDPGADLAGPLRRRNLTDLGVVAELPVPRPREKSYTPTHIFHDAAYVTEDDITDLGVVELPKLCDVADFGDIEEC